MAALARAVAGLLVRGGWLLGLLALETGLLLGFWFSGPTPFGDAFDRRAAEADLLLLTLTSLPALFAGALLASGDREDGLTDFARSCQVSSLQQVIGTGLGLFAVAGGALALALPLSLAVGAPTQLLTSSVWVSLGLGLLSTAVHGTWGLALGSWVHSRWTAVVAALAFWIVSVFALEAGATVLIGALPARWTLPVLGTFVAADPSQLFRVASVVARGQGWAYGPAFAEARDWFGTPPGVVTAVGLALLHGIVPGALAVAGGRRRNR